MLWRNSARCTYIYRSAQKPYQLLKWPVVRNDFDHDHWSWFFARVPQLQMTLRIHYRGINIILLTGSSYKLNVKNSKFADKIACVKRIIPIHVTITMEHMAMSGDVRQACHYDSVTARHWLRYQAVLEMLCLSGMFMFYDKQRIRQNVRSAEDPHHGQTKNMTVPWIESRNPEFMENKWSSRIINSDIWLNMKYSMNATAFCDTCMCMWLICWQYGKCAHLKIKVLLKKI